MSMSETVNILDALEVLRDGCYENSKAHGFWQQTVCPRCNGESVGKILQCPDCKNTGKIEDGTWNFGEKIALIHTELSEMFEAWRKNVGHLPCDKDIRIIAPDGTRRITAVEEEVADVFIRLMDLCGKLDIDVGSVVMAKMAYNKGRPYKHGGRKS